MVKKSKNDGKNKDLPEEDKALWQSVTKEIKPLQTKLEKSLQSEDKNVLPPRMGATKRPIIPIPPQKTPAPPKQPHQLDLRTDLKLKKGQMPIEARLDLHGYTKDSAHTALLHFLQRCHAGGMRCVLVITGKGVRQGINKDYDVWDRPKAGVLKTMLPQWIKEPPLSSIVLKTHAATQKDGGGGALYIYLKRTRNY